MASKERIRVVEGDRSITLQVGEKYRHFKGGLYTIVGFAAHTETYDTLVIYTDSRGYHWARPVGMFIDMVPLHSNSDQLVPRFEKVGDRIEERHICTEGWTGCSNPVILKQIQELETEDARLREKLEQTQAQAAAMREALEHILEYWNRDRNDEAMYDALEEIIYTAENALSTDAGRELLERVQKLEAQCAMMREALLNINELGNCDKCGQTYVLHDIADIKHKALSTDAGRA